MRTAATYRALITGKVIVLVLGIKVILDTNVNFLIFLAPTGAQGVTMSIHLSVRPFGTICSRAV